MEPKRGPARRSRLSEYAQVAGLLDRYVLGESRDRLALSGMETPFKKVSRNGVKDLHVWEARLTDTRVFGWCVRPGVWIGVDGARASAVKARPRHSAGSYEAYARSVARWRQAAGFKAADIWTGEELDAFLISSTDTPL